MQKKELVENCVILSISDLYRQGVVVWNARRSGVLSNNHCSMRFQLKDNVLTLAYQMQRGAETYSIDEHIQIEQERIYQGGSRLWMHCPSCQRRVGKLYLSPGRTRYLCRACANLTYRACQEHRHGEQDELAPILKQLTRL